jgi:hypothetical protein
LPHVAEAQRELRQRRLRRAALEQQPDAGGEARAVGAGLAVDQRRLLHGAVDLGQAQDAVAVRRAAALEGRVHVGEAERRRLRPAQRSDPQAARSPRRLMTVRRPKRRAAWRSCQGSGWLER